MTEEQYAVSVIIPAYNAEKCIGRCLDSLICQTLFERLQIIVINDGSTDNTEQVCKGYAQKHSNLLVVSKANEGQGIARNYGFRYAKGNYIGFVDADDYVDREMYESLYQNAVETNSEWAYSYAPGEVYLQEERITDYKNGKIIKTKQEKQIFKKMMLGGLPEERKDSSLGMSVWRSIFKRDIVEKNNITFMSERKVNSEDLLFNLDFLNVCETLCTVNINCYHYCQDNLLSFSKRPNPKRLEMFKELYLELKKRTYDSEENLRINRRMLANIRVIMVEKARWCTRGEYKRTRSEILNILNDKDVVSLLKEYPIEKLPFMQKTYFVLMRMKLPTLIIIFAKLRYSLIK